MLHAHPPRRDGFLPQVRTTSEESTVLTEMCSSPCRRIRLRGLPAWPGPCCCGPRPAVSGMFLMVRTQEGKGCCQPPMVGLQYWTVHQAAGPAHPGPHMTHPPTGEGLEKARGPTGPSDERVRPGQ